MIKKENSKNIMKSKILLSLPIIAIMFFVFSCSNKNEELPTSSNMISNSKPDFDMETYFDSIIKKSQKTSKRNYIDSVIAQRIRYPQEAIDKGIEGTVLIGYTITETGKVVNVKVKRGVCKSLDNEAIRVVSTLGNALRGMHDGEPVTLVSIATPITFKLKK